MQMRQTPDNAGTTRSALIELELDALYQVSRVLSRSLDMTETLREVLKLLHETSQFRNGMVSLIDEDGTLQLGVVHGESGTLGGPVSYRPGEGITGMILAKGQTIVVPRIKSEPRFLDRLGLYDPELPFVGVPIFSAANEAVGVLAAQPPVADDLLDERARFLEMVANLIAQIVRLARQVEKRQKELRDERDTLRRAVKRQHGFDTMVGNTKVMRTVFDQVRMVSKWDTTVLIRGESGTGKELIANAIHYNSPRASGAFVKLNCAALPDNLLESELFGHEKGAFTGASTQRKGRFEQADGGTIFLDEIGEISPAFQAKLLRVLQEGEFERVGGARTLKVDVRVIAATNRDLENEVAGGKFREDLYYRLNVMPIHMPALRERAEDIPELCRFLIDKIAKKQGRPLTITDSAVRLLLRHPWPGNVRELENSLERAAIMCADGAIDRDVISLTGLGEGMGAAAPSAPAPSSPAPMAPAKAPAAPPIDFDDPDMDERERVIAALEEAGWVQAKAARLLGMTPRQIAYRIQTLNITVRRI